MPTITVCTDASFSQQYKLGTWACYIRTPKRKILKSGVLQAKVKSSSEAETLGLANALFILNKFVDLSDYRVIVYCDNTTALAEPKIRKTPKSKYYQKSFESNRFYKQHISDILGKSKSYEMRHVKGHLPKEQWDKGSSRNFMNKHCDIEAKRLLRLEKAKLKGLQK